jgi:hypothetical protein
MQRESFTTRLRLGIASVAALAVVCMTALAGTASAGIQVPPALVGFDPETTNVPYLAWRGEKVRLVKCVLPETVGLGGMNGGIDNGPVLQQITQFFTGTNAVIEDWSGDQFNRPQFEVTGNGLFNGLFVFNSNVGVFPGTGEMAGRVCFATTLVSLKAGVAIVKLSVAGVEAEFDVSEPVAQQPFPPQPVMFLQHQFTVAWMNIASTNVEDIGPSSIPAAGVPEAICETFQEDAAGNLKCVAFVTEATPGTTDAAGNQVQVTVTGSIPMEGNFDEWNAQLGRPGNQPMIMPQDWDDWAGIWARSSIAGNERNPCLWDIHDEFTGAPAVGGVSPAAPVAGDNHNKTADPCIVGPSAPGRDEVDNVTGGDEFGPFSRFIHNFADNPPEGPQAVELPGETVVTVGPFDPKRRDSSYIPDGYLNEGDAPMPAARVDVRIDPAGIGALVPIDKHAVYDGNTTHPLWAPYYGTFLPSTFAQRPFTSFDDPNTGLGTTASGIDGPATGNNFHGFLNNFAQGGLYHFWDFAVATGRLSQPIINPITGQPCPPFAPGFEAQTPSGFNEVTVYTDEHGEARVGFASGIGFNPAGLPIVFNANGGCDIQGIAQLGTNTISAVARYPYQPVTAPDVAGDELVPKAVTSAFNKQVTCVPKGAGLANQVAFICTASAIGINGQPFVGETVCFISNAEAILPLGPPGTNPGLVGAAVTCVLTNNQGQASVEIFGKGTVNVIAFFVEEGLLRFTTLAPPTTVPLTPGGTAPQNPPAGASQTVTSTASPTQAQVVSLLGNTTPQQPTSTPNQPQAAKSVLRSARLVYTRAGRRLVVRVQSPNRTVRIRIVMRGKGSTVATAVRRVRTNRAVTVGNLRIARKVNRVTVSVLR